MLEVKEEEIIRIEIENKRKDGGYEVEVENTIGEKKYFKVITRRTGRLQWHTESALGFATAVAGNAHFIAIATSEYNLMILDTGTGIPVMLSGIMDDIVTYLICDSTWHLLILMKNGKLKIIRVKNNDCHLVLDTSLKFFLNKHPSTIFKLHKI